MWIPHGRGIFLAFRPLLSTSLSSHVLPRFFFCLLWSGLALTVPLCSYWRWLLLPDSFPPPCLSPSYTELLDPARKEGENIPASSIRFGGDFVSQVLAPSSRNPEQPAVCA
ncbi:hypothetical protein CTAM01_05902 [Colletotrichum tamarilloi]|uniref:Uncharacterized protein n=1 Tax=Colletotrichum tamarilloi TaxID=1209934 RepID=A0ABQ9RDS6_9PEZI|nr:uncharacterized protein CTAM01_05902 [Colletotrichum tamarilloi]KAK1501678.1 hypothetical protein CTAM01_05902 [Colletotrichum tamarilloi]